MSTTRWCAVGAILMLAAGLTPVAPVRDAVTFSAEHGVRLVTSPAFLALAPLNNILDALSLLSLRQHVALLITILVVVWCLARLRGVAVAIVALAAIYVAGVLVPRPMAALAVDDPNTVIVDFHSHTSASHDGRRGFGREINRGWHAASGFTAAYVTDHNVLFAADTIRQGVALLGGVELWNGDEHVVVLGTRPADSALVHGKALNVAALHHVAALHRGIVIETIPGHLATLPVGGIDDRVAAVQAIEISDATPKGFGQIDRDRARVLRLADSAGLALVSASDNHGWGRTAAAWSLIEIPGWRTMTPDSLDAAIEATIRSGGRSAVRVVERTRPTVESTVGLVAIGPVVVWNLISTRSWAERVAWVVWLGAVAWIVRRWA
jgi:hypothetical protein